VKPIELPTMAVASRERYSQLARRARLLSWLSLAWMTVEGAVAITAGVVASSIALVGFGLDSVIEGLASVIIIWRFTGDRLFSERAELRAQKLVAVQFFLLAPYVGFEAIKSLVAGDHPDVSRVGIGLAVGSVILMPLLGRAKERLADQMGSAATKGEGRQNMLCAYLAGALLVGLLGNALVGAWWLDPAVGLLIAAVAVREGVDAWRGEGCCVSSPVESGMAVADECCNDDARCEHEPIVIPMACSLDADGAGRQRDRYAEIGSAVLSYGRTDMRLVAELAPAVDVQLVEETLAIERECCPFFQVAYDSDTRELSVEVERAEQAPALDAIAEALALRPYRRSTSSSSTSAIVTPADVSR
jgi:hypothetical protein